MINILKSEVYNKISAGEVVERPSSVVKELVENAIDANATSITVEIINGGLDYIKVSDNGFGIPFNDVKNAFLPHATSKLQTAEDLESISSLGFRGEALASIAAVSKINMITRFRDEDIGANIIINGGEVTDFNQFGASQGVTIEVNELFFNTPARRKFLKKPSGEGSEVDNVMARLILANPKIKIKFINNGEIIYNSQGKSVESAIFTVYGKEVINNILPIDHRHKNFKLSGYIGKTTFTKPNSTYQTIVINGRVVSNNTISLAVKTAYKDYLMTRNYPFAVLYLEVPVREIDVNVHPSKLEVRFIDKDSIFSTIYSPINYILKNEIKNLQYSNYSEDNKLCQPDKISEVAEIAVSPSYDSNKFENVINQSKIENGFYLRQEYPKIIDDMPQENFTVATIKDEYTNVQVSSLTNIDKLNEYTLVGVLFNTYLILQTKNNVLFVDQHAAHERLLFDKFTNAQEIASQGLLMPYIFTVKAIEYEFLNDNLSTFINLGFEIMPFGKNTFKINSVPSVLFDMSIKAFTDTLLSDMENCHFNPLNFQREKLIQLACKTAIKAGDKLSDYEINYVINAIKENQNFKCPHGRPIVIELKQSEVEKWFKRIV